MLISPATLSEAVALLPTTNANGLKGLVWALSNSRDYNPNWFQIDPQLVNEIWAVTAPGMVDYATQNSAWAARITNDGFGIEPTIHYAAMYAAAFFEERLWIGVQDLSRRGHAARAEPQ